MSLAFLPSICYFRPLPWWFSSCDVWPFWYHPKLLAYLLWGYSSWRTPSVSVYFLWMSLFLVCHRTQSAMGKTHHIGWELVGRGLLEGGQVHGEGPGTIGAVNRHFWCGHSSSLSSALLLQSLTHWLCSRAVSPWPLLLCLIQSNWGIEERSWGSGISLASGSHAPSIQSLIPSRNTICLHI